MGDGMKVEILNWGPIGKCELNLDKNLLVIYGDNNIGKSYAMQVLYLVLKRILAMWDVPAYMWYFRKVEPSSEIMDWIRDFSDKKELKERNVTKDLIQLYEKQLNEEMLPGILKSFYNTFGTYDDILNEKPSITLRGEDGFLFQILPAEERICLELPVKSVFLKKTTSSFHKSREFKSRLDIYVYSDSEIQSPTQLLTQQLWKMNNVFQHETIDIIRDVYFLPASRSGIYTGMNAFGPIMAQLSQNRYAIHGSISIPSIPETITDYYVDLSSIRSETRGRFADTARKIEEEILDGRVEFDSKKKTLIYTGSEENSSMEMSDVSSMVSELSPITAYLKYIVEDTSERRRIQKGHVNSQSVLFIEEPEAHLHPQNQVKLIKIFAELAKQNVKIVLASHSNYIFNELNNLVLGGNLDSTVYAPILMKRNGNKSFTMPMPMDEFGVDDEDFADVANILIEEREQLIQGIMDTLQKGKNDTEDKTDESIKAVSTPEN